MNWSAYACRGMHRGIGRSYEKKCVQLRTHDANGAEPFTIERTRATIRNLRTKLNITVAFVKDVSRRVVVICDSSSKCTCIYYRLLDRPPLLKNPDAAGV